MTGPCSVVMSGRRRQCLRLPGEIFRIGSKVLRDYKVLPARLQQWDSDTRALLVKQSYPHPPCYRQGCKARRDRCMKTLAPRRSLR
jgi:hypothetical protein